MAQGRKKSLIGERFGKLVVKEYAQTDKFRNTLWLCECDCGRETIEKGTLLTRGKVISCGICSTRLAVNPTPIEVVDKSLVGQRFGKLVIEDTFYKKKNENAKSKVQYAKCKCDCGNETEVLVSSLKTGNTLSCGCLQREKIKNTKYHLTDDFIGERFGKLVISGYDETQRKWKCKCDCGNEIYLLKSSLTVNGYRSCGHCNNKSSKNRRTREELENARNNKTI